MSEFDKFSKNYTEVNDFLAKNMSGFGLDYFNEYKIKDLYSEASRTFSSTNLAILDFGCGVGNSMPHLRKYFSNSDIYGVDVSLESIKLAEVNSKNYDVQFLHLISEAPFDDGKFDIIFSACVFHHIRSDLRIFWLNELHRLLKPGGLLMIYEHNPYNPVTQYIFNTSEFDRNASMLSAIELRSILRSVGYRNIDYYFRSYFPKWLSFFLKFEPFLRRLPLGAQYYAIGIK